MIAHAPEEWTVLLIGVDGRGDCRLGQVRRLQIEGRPIEFLPVLHYPDDHVHQAARSLFASLTLQFAIGLLRYLFVTQAGCCNRFDGYRRTAEI